MKRRDFLRYSVNVGMTLGAGTLLPRTRAFGSTPPERGAGIQVGSMVLPENPGFETKHLVVIIYGNGARKTDVLDNPGLAPHQNALAREGTVFTEDYGETASQHGYMYSEILQGVNAPGSQRPLYPTWNEYVRKKTAAKATDFFVLQGVSYYRAWAFDVKHYSEHPDYGLPYGATSLTMNKTFRVKRDKTPREIVDINVETGLGASDEERKALEEFIADVTARKAYLPPSTKELVIERPVHYHDAQVLTLAPLILRAFKPKIITLQICGLDEAHADFGHWNDRTGYSEYTRHLKTTDELIGKLWSEVQSDPTLRDNTALVLRPECGRDDEINPYGQLGHTTGNYHAHFVWTLAVGPDFRKGAVVTEQVSRRDLAPTVTYLMSGESAEYASGHVRTQMFKKTTLLPDYVPPAMADWESERKAPGCLRSRKRPGSKT